jgi:SAM-dependent methyltransferase
MEQFEAAPKQQKRPLEFALGSVRFGDLKRLSPIGRDFGWDRGTPVDRYYIESFLARNSTDVRGRVLELASNDYTKRFGSARVLQSDVLSLKPTNPNATIVGDLARAGSLPDAAFDCIIFTQALQYIFDTRAAIETLHRALKPGGVLLATAPGVTHVDVLPWYWTFTAGSLGRLLAEQFGNESVTVEAHGNVLAATAFLYGLVIEELEPADLDFDDANYPVAVAGRAVKQTEP